MLSVPTASQDNGVSNSRTIDLSSPSLLCALDSHSKCFQLIGSSDIRLITVTFATMDANAFFCKVDGQHLEGFVDRFLHLDMFQFHHRSRSSIRK